MLFQNRTPYGPSEQRLSDDVLMGDVTLRKAVQRGKLQADGANIQNHSGKCDGFNSPS